MGSDKEPHKRFLPLKSDNDRSLLIIDHEFWTRNDEELARWLIDNTQNGLYCREGMILTFSNADEMSWFLLRWG